MKTLHRNHADFAALVATARRHSDGGRPDAAAAYAQIAGQFAWMNHTGRFASPELDELLSELGAQCASAPRPAARVARPHTILHVLTQAYQTGGSTREVACWIEQDRGRHHQVCITRQGPAPPPEFILSGLSASSDLVRLDRRRGGLMARAAALRALGAQADVVVLHTHPHDVVPAIAFAHEGRPPVICVNHADHVFWVGLGGIDLLSNMRESGHELAVTRRGVDPRRSIVMARPLMPGDRTLERAEAKRRLGVDPDAVLLVTAADASKYRPVGRDDFLDLVCATLEHHPGAVLLAAGPSPADGAWTAAAGRTDGRIRALGRLPDVTLLHEAADVYLDSFPFSSLTSLLEAGSLGTPAITYRGHPADCAVLGADTPGVDDHLLRPADPEAYARALSRVIEEPGWRREVGARTARAIRETHTGEGWRTSIGRVYELAAQSEGRPIAGPVPEATGLVDALVHRVMVQTGYSQGTTGAVRDNLVLLPLTQRAPEWLGLARSGALPSLRHVVPEWLAPRLWRWRVQARALVSHRRNPTALRGREEAQGIMR